MIEKLKTFLKQFPRHWLTAASAWMGKVISTLVQIVSIRSLLLYLGEDRYAVYIIAYSVSAWASLAQFGISTSLLNFISECRAKNESFDKYLVAALQIAIALTVIFIILILLFSNFFQSILFRKFTNLPELNNLPIVAVVAIISVITAIMLMSHMAYLALHKGFIPNILSASASVISMFLIVIFNHYDLLKHSIVIALLIFLMPQLFCVLLTFIPIFKKHFSHIFNIDLKTIKEFFTRALKFHGLNIFYCLSTQMDYLIISQTLNPNSILTYNIFLRFFMLPIFVFITFVGSSWPRLSEMYIKKEITTIRKILKRYSVYAILLVVFCAIMIFLFSPIAIKLLMPGVDIKRSLFLILLFSIYTLLTCWSELAKTFLQSINALRIFWIYMPFQIIISIIMQFYLSKKYGTEGIIIGLIISIVLTAFWVLPMKTYKVLKSAQIEENKKMDGENNEAK